MKIYKNRKKKVEILTVQDWIESCPPTNPIKQWVDKRSAKEMARFWTDIQKQNDFLMYLKKVNKELSFNYALPEISTKFDDYKSPRKTDLCIFAKSGNNKVLISIEGKSDEHFGENYVDKEWTLSIQAKTKNKDSKKLDRIIELYKRFDSNANFISLRYQLTYWLAGSIDEAIRNEIDTVFLIVQEFDSEITSKKKFDVNKDDLDYFVNFITNSNHKKIDKNELIGPIKNQFTKQINLYIGKYQTYLE